jgi:hypothetical protein
LIVDDIEEEAGPPEIHLWTWSGRYFGSSDGAALWTHSGRLAGRFHQDEIYGAAGRYLGEVRDNDRLITNSSKKNQSQGPFGIRRRRARPVAEPQSSRPMIDGFEDFTRARGIRVRILGSTR